MNDPEFESIDDMLEDEIESINDEIESFAQQAINEENRESEGILIEEELRQQGFSEDRIEELTEKGIELLENDIPTKNIPVPKEKSFSPPQKTGGSEGNPKAWHYPTEVQKQRDSPWPKGEKSAYTPTKRERFEAMKEGLTEYLENETRRPSNDPNIIKHRESEEEKTIKQLEEIEAQLETLPPHPEEQETEIEDVSDEEARAEGWRDNHERKHWKKDTQGHDQFLTKQSKNQKLNSIKSLLSVGITPEDLAECASAQSRIAARAHLPLSMLPENMDKPYDIEELEEEIGQAEEDPEKDYEDDAEETSSEEDSAE